MKLFGSYRPLTSWSAARATLKKGGNLSASYGSALIAHSSFSHLFPYSLSIILYSVLPLCSFHWCLCLPEESMAHRHRNRQPWQVEIAASAAMHDTPCDRGMPTLWNRNEHCALTPSLPACTGFYTQFSRAYHAGAPCLICILHMQPKPLFHSQAGQSGQRSLPDLRILTLENWQRYISCNQEIDWDGLTWLSSCV